MLLTINIESLHCKCKIFRLPESLASLDQANNSCIFFPSDKFQSNIVRHESQ